MHIDMGKAPLFTTKPYKADTDAEQGFDKVKNLWRWRDGGPGEGRKKLSIESFFLPSPGPPSLHLQRFLTLSNPCSASVSALYGFVVNKGAFPMSMCMGKAPFYGMMRLLCPTRRFKLSK